MEQAMRRHFFHHGENGHEDEKRLCHWCQIRTFATHARYPITIVNNEDDTMIQPNFQFRDCSQPSKDIEPTKEGFLTGCLCSKDDDCRYNTCHCQEDVDDDSFSDDDEAESTDDEADTSEGEAAAKRDAARHNRKKVYAYHTRGVKTGHIRSRILASRNPIYECHKSCKCSPNCPNRVVERGRRVPLQIFRTKNRGWGVRSTMDIKKGQFLDKYMGEIITAAEANKRRAHSHIAEKKDVYLFALDKFSNPESLDGRLRGPPLEVDGEFISGPTRFINHSCEPNLRIFARVGDHADKHIHDLAFFAIRDIPRGEELTFDYIDGVDDSDMDALDPEKQKDMARCLCGSKNCRGYLW